VIHAHGMGVARPPRGRVISFSRTMGVHLQETLAAVCVSGQAVFGAR